MSPRCVYVAFVAENSAITEPHPLNRLAAWLAPRPKNGRPLKSTIIHCELFFPNHANEVVQSMDGARELRGESFGIYYGGQVFKVPKRFSRSDYIFKSIPLTETQYTRMHTFLNAQVGKGFNYVGYASHAFPKWCCCCRETPCGPQRFYCSQLAMAALNYACVFGADDQGNHVQLPVHVHPHEVFYLIDDYATCESHPYKSANLNL